jgi:UDP-N-acetylmuramate dehydrogenase
VVPQAECGFAYRTSVFQQHNDQAVKAGSDASVSSPDQEMKRVVLTRAILRCDNSASEKAKELDAQAKELLARRHRTQPKLRSAGSLFKNPPGDFAGRLIEASGLKGFTVGRAQVSPVHANFVVNLGGAHARDVVAVADHVIATVENDHGVTLEWEVRRVGEP